MLKKLAALLAAAVLMAQGGVFAFADAPQDSTPFVNANEIFIAEAEAVPRLVKNGSESIRMNLLPLSTLYISVENAEYAEDFNDLRVVIEWNKGEEYAFAPRIEYRMVYDESGKTELGYRYLVAMQMLDMADLQQRTLRGELKLAHRRNERTPSVSFTISVQRKQTPDYEKTVHCESKSFRLLTEDMSDTYRVIFCETSYFDIDLTTQGNMDIGCSTAPITDIAERFREAKLRFISWSKKPFFDCKGRFVMLGEPDEFFYEIKNGHPVQRNDCYSADDGGFAVDTRRLEGFIVSDRELDLSAVAVPEPNPPTGAGL